MSFLQKSLDAPVLFLVFNRSDTTKQVLEAIRKASPSKLFVAADGPRKDRPGEAESCAEVRRVVDDGIDWDCEVHRLYRDENLGCKVAISGAISWFFENVQEGIILEDDCLPNQSFFRFCQELLEKYRNDERIMRISGCSLQSNFNGGDGSYYFSKYGLIWGWATWKRAWQHYDVNMSSFPYFKKSNAIKEIFENTRQQKYWQKILEGAYEGKYDAWDYHLAYSAWIRSGLSVMPNVNMVSNIGFRNDATHTRSTKTRYVDMPTFKIDEIVHPRFLMVNKKADQFTFNCVFKDILIRRIIRKIKRILTFCFDIVLGNRR